MAVIRQLDPHVADLIAAGEVVERPASVVKELMENAIDAGAGSITVEIARGGMALMRVTDDGCGIPADQAATAFLRHATSKISSARDLESIGTLGFRGEALAAIAAVSRIELHTRPQQDALGTVLFLEGGRLVEQEEGGCPMGTTMVVRDLFFNTPARQKFMKKDSAEGAAVFAVVQRVALSHPELSVKFVRDGRQELLTPGDGQLKSAVYAVLGRDIALGLLPVSAADQGIGVTGFVSRPACCRGSRSYQHFFVNGRYVKSRLMMAAVEEAYQNQKMVGRFPSCVLHLTLGKHLVDVNVHPAKTEVKFQNEGQIFAAIHHAVRSALGGDRTRPQAVLPGGSAPEHTAQQLPLTLRDSGAAGIAPIPARPGQNPFAAPAPQETSSPRVHTMDGAHPFRRVDPLPPSPPPAQRTGQHTPPRGAALTPPQQRPAVPAARPAQRGQPMATGTAEAAPAAPSPTPGAPVPSGGKPSASDMQPVSAAHAPTSEVQPAPAQPAPRPSQAPPSPQRSQPTPAHPLPPTPTPDAPDEADGQSICPPQEPWVVRGELFHTYVLVEQGDQVLLIDKHAAHERANFDRLKAEDYRPMVQELLVPITLRPDPEERQTLLDHAALLERFGFAAEELGPTALVVRAVPDYLAPDQVEGTLLELARSIRDTGSADPTAARDTLLHTMACKAAVKGGQRNDPQELERVAQLVLSGQVRFCPHGRPVAIQLTRAQLEKQFKRT